MTVVFIEPRPKGHVNATEIESLTVETGADAELESFRTQGEAIRWAKNRGFSVRIARVRNTDKRNPDHWREA